MKPNSSEEKRDVLLNRVLLAGFCGGVAEIVWVGFYCFLTGQRSAEVASQVTATLFPDAANMAFAPGLGIAIHLVLSLLVALFYAALVWLPFVRRFGPAASMAVASAALASIWAINFLVVLPVLNPIFVSLLPHAVTFGSKILFGIAMAGVLMGAQRQRDDEEPGVSRRIVV